MQSNELVPAPCSCALKLNEWTQHKSLLIRLCKLPSPSPNAVTQGMLAALQE